MSQVYVQVGLYGVLDHTAITSVDTICLFGNVKLQYVEIRESSICWLDPAAPSTYPPMPQPAPRLSVDPFFLSTHSLPNHLKSRRAAHLARSRGRRAIVVTARPACPRGCDRGSGDRGRGMLRGRRLYHRRGRGGGYLYDLPCDHPRWTDHRHLLRSDLVCGATTTEDKGGEKERTDHGGGNSDRGHVEIWNDS